MSYFSQQLLWQLWRRRGGGSAGFNETDCGGGGVSQRPLYSVHCVPSERQLRKFKWFRNFHKTNFEHPTCNNKSQDWRDGGRSNALTQTEKIASVPGLHRTGPSCRAVTCMAQGPYRHYCQSPPSSFGKRPTWKDCVWVTRLQYRRREYSLTLGLDMCDDQHFIVSERLNAYRIWFSFQKLETGQKRSWSKRSCREVQPWSEPSANMIAEWWSFVQILSLFFIRLTSKEGFPD